MGRKPKFQGPAKPASLHSERGRPPSLGLAYHTGARGRGITDRARFTARPLPLPPGPAVLKRRRASSFPSRAQTTAPYGAGKSE